MCYDFIDSFAAALQRDEPEWMALLVWILLAAIVFVSPTWLLWNWLMPDLFGLPEITFFQCLGLMLLCGMLFKSSVKISIGN